MKIVEIFYSLQGEGALAGKPSIFIRLAGCPLRCKWCDTKYAWHARCGDDLSIDEIMMQVSQYDCRYVVITGGEPFVNSDLPDLLCELKDKDKYITVETAGIEFVAALPIDLLSISPKLANSTPIEIELAAMHEKNRLNKDAIVSLVKSYNCQIKFVVDSADDLPEIKQILSDCDITPSMADIMLMPQAADVDEYIEKSRLIAELCIKEGLSFSPRLHTLLWGNKRGV